jgi:DNA topoisomerase-1
MPKAANVVVVESPAKARTIGRYLGSDYKVHASYGHVRDLIAKDGAVQPDDDFSMHYETPGDSRKHIKSIASDLDAGGTLFLATDPDREGEAIAWHVLAALRERGGGKSPDFTTHRVSFHEVTREAILEAFEKPGAINMDLVDAQQARRALDHLVGFTLSPILWRKLPGARSAGRVQSVALRLICEREMEIEAFKPREYWTLEVALTNRAGEAFTARLVSLDGDSLGKFGLPDETAARHAAERVAASSFQVAEVKKKRVLRSPPAPFTTSTLQQEASRKLGFSAARTMRTAQSLYEGVAVDGASAGLITYMRTDSVNLAPTAVAAIREAILREFGEQYQPAVPNRFRSRARNAQEAHEAIRPTDVARGPAALARQLAPDQAKLYQLIWNRTVASQMEKAEVNQTTAEIRNGAGDVGLRATGSTVVFDGFQRLYSEGRDQPEKEGDTESENGRRLPALERDEELGSRGTEPKQHFTTPPPRFTEASLVRRLEELGVGRPSTYVSIISVLQDREYVRLEKKRFVPESRGRIVTTFLECFFERYVEYDFTANLEQRLDDISRGQVNWKAVLRDFWGDFKENVDEVAGIRLRSVIDRLDAILAPVVFPVGDGGRDPRLCPTCGKGKLGLRIGKFGAFFGCSNYPECKHTRNFGLDDDQENGEPVTLGDFQDQPVTLRTGRFGPYVQLGDEAGKDQKPKRVSLPGDIAPSSVDLECALQLLALPRDIGPHPESGEPVQAGIGRYGPYVKHQKDYRSIPAGESVLTIGMNRAMDLLAQEKGRSRQSARTVLGSHPSDGKEVTVQEGRFGPYVKHGRLNASLPKDTSMSEVTMEQAVALLAARAQRDATKKAPARRRRSTRKS